MKKGGLHSAPIIELPTHPHSAMNPTTKSLIRNAVIEAINAEHDDAAMELLSLLNENSTAVQSAVVASSDHAMKFVESRVVEGPSRDYHYWAKFIRENFIPFLTANGRARFTSRELFSWLENNPAVLFTAGEVELRSDGYERWRGIVSNALTALKDRGMVQAAEKGRCYAISGRVDEQIQHVALLP